MTQSNSIISPKTLGVVAALVVPMLLFPTSGNARSSHQERHYFDQPIKVSQGFDRRNRNYKSERRALDRLFDRPAPRKSKTLNRARNKQLNRSHKRGNKRSRQRGYYSDHYEDDFAMSCRSPRQIHQDMRRQGWRKFHNLRIRPTVLRFKARQRNGLTYNVKIDRCSGSLIKAKIQFQDRWYLRWIRRVSAAF